MCSCTPVHMKLCLLALMAVKCLSLWEPSLLGASYEPGNLGLSPFSLDCVGTAL